MNNGFLNTVIDGSISFVNMLSLCNHDTDRIYEAIHTRDS